VILSDGVSCSTDIHIPQYSVSMLIVLNIPLILKTILHLDVIFIYNNAVIPSCRASD
jgi:hypothetical protein